MLKTRHTCLGHFDSLRNSCSTNWFLYFKETRHLLGIYPFRPVPRLCYENIIISNHPIINCCIQLSKSISFGICYLSCCCCFFCSLGVVILAWAAYPSVKGPNYDTWSKRPCTLTESWSQRVFSVPQLSMVTAAQITFSINQRLSEQLMDE